MANDTLKVFGKTFTGVAGVKANDPNHLTKAYVRPEGELEITENGVSDVTNYASVNVDVFQLDTSDATATSSDILSGKTAYVDGEKVTGNIASKAAATYTPGTTDQTIASGQYLSGAQTIKGDADLVASNIKENVDIFGVTGTLKPLSTTSDATATSSDILNGKTAYVNSTKVTGNIASLPATTYTPGTQDYSIGNGWYLSGPQTIKGDADLIPGNIKKNVEIFGVTGTYTSDATAASSDILSGKTAYVNGSKVTGSIASKAAATYTPGTTDQTIASGQYLSGAQTIKGDADLVAENIKDGVEIFGVTGTHKGGKVRTTPYPKGTVRFIDYDGTILYTYTAAEFRALSAMPANPTHSGLVSQGWNWSLAKAQSYVFNYGSLDIGQMYATESGATEIDIALYDLNLTFKLQINVNGTVDIDWGDGNTGTVSGSGDKNAEHTYTTSGNYTIKLINVSGNYYFIPAVQQVYKSAVKNVRLSDSVERIYSAAFNSCYSLRSITIPDSVTIIYSSAFINCTSLQSVIIPDGATNINSSIFDSCFSLHFVSIPNSVTSIGTNAFSGCRSLQSVTIPDSVTSIGASAFNACYSLQSITIPDSVTSIGASAFTNCGSLHSVTIPDSVTNISASVFMNCGALQFVTIPDGVTSIGASAFYSCDSLRSVTIPDSVTSIGDSAFSTCTSLYFVTIPDSVTSIGANAFKSCVSLIVIIPPESANVDSTAFTSYECYTSISSSSKQSIDGKAITFAEIPDGATSISASAFNGCRFLKSVTMPDSVTSIGNSAFSDCRSLQSVTIPDSVTSIGTNAFSGCRSLQSVTIPDSVTSIGASAFYNCYSLRSITIPDGVTSIGASAFNACYSLRSITIPDGVTSIGANAFSTCRSLQSVTIPDSVTSIGASAFYSCDSLRSVTIPDGVTSIGNYAFYFCASLQSVTMPDGVTSIAPNAFNNCYALHSFTIPDSVTDIGNNAFYNCRSLQSITIPDGVTSIGSNVFGYCLVLSFIKFKSATPPTVANSNAFTGIPETCIIYVPTGSLEAYTTATNYPSSSTYTYVEYTP